MKKKKVSKGKIEQFSVFRWFVKLLIPSVLTVLLAIFVLRSSLHSDKESVISYNEIGNIDYKVYLKENNYYPSEYLEKNMQYIANLINKVNIDFNYEMHSSQDMKYQYGYNIKANLVITDPNDNNKILYKKTNILVNDKKMNVVKNNFVINDEVSIDYNEYNNYVNAFKKEYALSVKSKIIITMEVTVDGENKLLKDKLSKKNNLSIAIPLSEQTIDISIDTSDINNSGVLEKTYLAQIKNPLVLGIGGFIAIISLYLSYICIYTIFSNMTSPNIYRVTIDKILKEYDRAIVTSNSIDSINVDEYKIIDVTSIEELLDAHDSTGQPILYAEVTPEEVSKFIVVADGILYRLVIDKKKLEDEEIKRIKNKNLKLQEQINIFKIFKGKDKK